VPSSYRQRVEGLVHVSQIRNGARLEKAAYSGYDVNDEVYVKLTQVRDDGKLSLSMKECDQYSGLDLNPERTQQLIQNDGVT
jgi:predicted RNA-binding protein with RPS1 domain